MIDITKSIETKPTSWQAAIPCEYVGMAVNGNYSVRIKGDHRTEKSGRDWHCGCVWLFTESGDFFGDATDAIQIRNVIEESVMTDKPSDAAILKAHQLLAPIPDLPLLIAAREICAEINAMTRKEVENFISGAYDDNKSMQYVIAKLREIKGD
jgi:hypothetical protein